MKFTNKIYFWSSGKIWKGLHNVIIQSFNRGYTPDIGCVIFEFVSHTLLVGGLTSTKYKVNAREVSNNKSVWDKNVVMWQLFPAYLKKWCKVYERLTWSKGMMYGWLGIACNSAPRYPNNHIWKEKVTHNHKWRAEQNIAHNPRWQEHLGFTDFLFWWCSSQK